MVYRIAGGIFLILAGLAFIGVPLFGYLAGVAGIVAGVALLAGK